MAQRQFFIMDFTTDLIIKVESRKVRFGQPCFQAFIPAFVACSTKSGGGEGEGGGGWE